MGDDEARRFILARRARFVAAALAAANVASAAACGGDTNPAPIPPNGADGGVDAGLDAGPQPCLTPLPQDAGDAGDDSDAGPQPCLAPPRD